MLWATQDLASSDGVLIPYGGTQVAPYPSLVDDGQERTLFYPDRKHYLLGKYLTDDWLADCDPATNPVRQRPPTDFFKIRVAAKKANNFGSLKRSDLAIRRLLASTFWADLPPIMFPVRKLAGQRS